MEVLLDVKTHDDRPKEERREEGDDERMIQMGASGSRVRLWLMGLEARLCIDGASPFHQ